MSSEFTIVEAPRATNIKPFVISAVVFLIVCLACIGLVVYFFSVDRVPTGYLYVGAIGTAVAVLVLYLIYAGFLILFKAGIWNYATISLGIFTLAIIVLSFILVGEASNQCGFGEYYDAVTNTCVSADAPMCQGCLPGEYCISGRCCPPSMACNFNVNNQPQACCDSLGEKCVANTCCPEDGICGDSCCGTNEECHTVGGIDTCCDLCGTDENNKICCSGGTICGPNNTCVAPCGYDNDGKPILCAEDEECVIVTNLNEPTKQQIIDMGGTVGPNPANPNEEVAFICMSKTASDCEFKSTITSYPDTATGTYELYPCFRSSKYNPDAGLQVCIPQSTDANDSQWRACGAHNDCKSCATDTNCRCVDLLQLASEGDNAETRKIFSKATMEGSSGYYCDNDPGTHGYSRIIVANPPTGKPSSCTWEDCYARYSGQNVTDLRFNEATGACAALQSCQGAAHKEVQARVLTTQVQPDGSIVANDSQVIENTTWPDQESTLQTCDNMTEWCDELRATTGQVCNDGRIEAADTSGYSCRLDSDGNPTGICDYVTHNAVFKGENAQAACESGKDAHGQYFCPCPAGFSKDSATGRKCVRVPPDDWGEKDNTAYDRCNTAETCKHRSDSAKRLGKYWEIAPDVGSDGGCGGKCSIPFGIQKGTCTCYAQSTVPKDYYYCVNADGGTMKKCTSKECNTGHWQIASTYESSAQSAYNNCLRQTPPS